MRVYGQTDAHPVTVQEARRRLLTIARDIQVLQADLRAFATSEGFYAAAEACDGAFDPLREAREALGGVVAR